MINCCYGCVPPKRTPTCKFDGTCNKYAEQKLLHDAEREQINKHRYIEVEIYRQRGEGVRRAGRRRKTNRS